MQDERPSPSAIIRKRRIDGTAVEELEVRDENARFIGTLTLAFLQLETPGSFSIRARVGDFDEEGLQQ